MAVYRSDQAQLTFAAEAAPGGSPERALLSSLNTGNAAHLTAAANAGDRSITVNAVTGFTSTGDAASFIQIDTNEDGVYHPATKVQHGAAEVRRVVGIDGTTLHLDYPLAFTHSQTASSSIDVQYATSVPETLTAASSTPYITWIPGIYDTVDAPDPEEAHEARYMLGQNTKRNAYQIVKGQQAFNGTVSGMVLINGWPLRFPIGSVVSVPTFASATAAATAGDGFNIEAPAGSVWIIFENMTDAIQSETANGLVLNNYIDINYTDPLNADSKRETRKIVEVSAGSMANDTNKYVRVNYPLQFAHTGETAYQFSTAAPTVVTHHIFEQTALTNVTWNLNVKDEDGTNAFQRRYYGGKVTGLTLTAEEGGLVMCDWDTAQFLGMIHNQKLSASSHASNAMRRYNPMIDIDKGMVGAPLDGDATVASHANTLPTSEPYYFSEGTVKLFGTTVARLRTFTLTIANNEEARYYIRQTYNDDRGPFEIKEQQREYTMTATIGLPDSSDPTTSGGLEVWKELVLGGEHELANGSTAGGMTGFDVELKFQRGGSATDQITVRIPGNYDGSTNTSAKGGGYQTQGAVIRSAAVNIDGSNPMEQSVDILFSDLKIEVTDSEPFYP